MKGVIPFACWFQGTHTYNCAVSLSTFYIVSNLWVYPSFLTLPDVKWLQASLASLRHRVSRIRDYWLVLDPLHGSFIIADFVASMSVKIECVSRTRECVCQIDASHQLLRIPFPCSLDGRPYSKAFTPSPSPFYLTSLTQSIPLHKVVRFLHPWVLVAVHSFSASLSVASTSLALRLVVPQSSAVMHCVVLGWAGKEEEMWEHRN